MQAHPRIQAPSIILLAVSAFGFLGALTAAIGLFLMGGIILLRDGWMSEGLFPVISFGWVGIFVALMVLPAMFVSVSRLTGIRIPNFKGPDSHQIANWLMISWPILLLSGQLVSEVPGLNLLVLPPLQLLVVGIPILWFVETGRRKVGSHQASRDWSLVSIGVVIIPVLVLAAELAVLGILAGGFLIWVNGQPDIMEQLSRLGVEISNSPMDEAVLENAIAELAGSPLFVFLVLAVTAVLVPMIEELLKPAPVWYLASQEATPAEGFEAGLICGGVFAFLESVGLFGTSFTGEWLAVVLARLGTGWLHTLASGLVGWAIVSSWQSRGVIRAGFVYFLAVVLHGLWNASAVVYGLYTYLPAGSSGWTGVLYQLGKAGPYALGFLSAGIFIIVVLFNRRLRTQSAGISEL